MTSAPEAPPFAPVDTGLRFVAGLIDLAVLALVGVGLALGPLWLGGLALPMVGAVAAVLVVQVLPLSAFRATLGLRLMGLEVVHRDGRAADMSELLFRELIGRGLLGLAFMSTLVIGGAGMWAGVMGMFSAGRLSLLGLLAFGVLMLGVASHILILGSRDRRGLHDLMGGTWVVARGTVQDPRDDADLDDEAKEVLGASGGKRWPKVALAQVIIAGLAVAVPYALSRPTPDAGTYEARAKMKRARSKFQADPADRRAAGNYLGWMRRAGEDEEDMQEVRQQHREAVAAQVAKQEAAIRKGLEDTPADWDRTAALVRLLEDQDRTTEARAAFESYAEADGTPAARASLGVWLYERGFAADAIEILREAKADGEDDATVHTYLGWALQETGDEAAALVELRAALAKAPHLEQVQHDVETLTAKLEPVAEPEPEPEAP